MSYNRSVKSYRLHEGGSLINRSTPVTFTFDGNSYAGYEGDTLASALLANGVRLMGRSFKYHRPRGVMTCGPEEPNALVGIGSGSNFEPNQRMTTTEIYQNLSATSQNRFPSLSFDVFSVFSWFSRFLPSGFYYKTFMYPTAFWKHVYEPVIRYIAGLGNAPTVADQDHYEHFYYHTDVLVVGGGVAGILAAYEVAQSGASVLLVEQNYFLKGRFSVDKVNIDGKCGNEWLQNIVEELHAMENVTIRTRTSCSACYDHNYCILYERLTDHCATSEEAGGGVRHRLWRVRARNVVMCTGAIERTIPFCCNDVPGVMLASAVRDYLSMYGVLVGKKVVVYTNNDDAYQTAIAIHDAGGNVPALLDVRATTPPDLTQQLSDRGIPVLKNKGIVGIKGNLSVEKVYASDIRESGRTGSVCEYVCDAVAVSGGWSPAVHIWCHSGGKLSWDEKQSLFRPDSLSPPVNHDGSAMIFAAGCANGAMLPHQAISDALSVGSIIAKIYKEDTRPHISPVVDVLNHENIHPLWFTPSYGKYADGTKHFIDFQNDVTAGDIELAIREGYTSVEHTKRYTTVGMATDQGKMSNMNAMGIMADALGISIDKVGTTTFRPPYTPISIGSIAGGETGELFKVVRRTPMHNWHSEHGAVWEPVGDWRRPFTYCNNGETREDAVNREILTTRKHAGLLDASTLGKIIVTGPDSGEFLDRVYTNMISTLGVGRCRYGLMCNENGFLFDDGVIARLSDDTFLCHTTSGGADRVYAWLEWWHQTEWYDLDIFIVNVTEQYGQVALVGPEARNIILELGTDIDMSKDSFKFMGIQEGTLGDCPVRIFRISFSGELSYEIATPLSYALSLWKKLLQVGKQYNITPYGTEALHVMRAEKGFIMIGDETDGTITPLDLGLGALVSKKKADFIGMRALKRSWLSDLDNRELLVGLETEDPAVVIPQGAYAVPDGDSCELPNSNTIGYITSSYWSPTLNRSIAMGLIKNGTSRMGEYIKFPLKDRSPVRAKIVSPIFYDKDGEKQNV